jgi:hypothetical protein
VLGTLEDRSVEMTDDVLVINVDPGLIGGVSESRGKEVTREVRIDEGVASRVVGESVSHASGHGLQVGVLERAHGHELTILRRV